MKSQTRNKKGYALVLVLVVLLVSMIFGSYLIRRSMNLDERSQMATEEKKIQQKAIVNFNFVADRIRSRVESAINAYPAEAALFSDDLCANDYTCVKRPLAERELSELGIRISLECRGEGSIATRCTTNKDYFPKEFLLRMQQINPENPEEIIFASGELRYQPIPLNAYALALTAAQDVNFGPGDYGGNIAIRLDNSSGTSHKVHLYPGPGQPINFNGVVSVSTSNFGSDGSDPDEAVVFHTSADAVVNYVGFRTGAQLDNLAGSFADAVNAALEDPSNTIIQGTDSSYVPSSLDVIAPDGVEMLSIVSNTYNKESTIALSRTTGLCATDARFEEKFIQVLTGRMSTLNPTPPAGFSFSTGNNDSSVVRTLCSWRPDWCSNGGACVEIGGSGSGGDIWCDFTRNVVEERHEGTLEDNTIIVSQDSKINIDRLNPSDRHASGCGTDFAVYAPNGVFNAKAGYKNYSGGATDNDLHAAFISGINTQTSSTSAPGVILFSEETLTEAGMTLGSVKSVGLPDGFDGPTLQFDATIVGLGQTRAVQFESSLLSLSGELLGKFQSRGGQIAARQSTYRMVRTNGANAGEVAAGFEEVKHDFELNQSPVLSSREFAANLEATVQNFNITYADPRIGMSELGLTWETTADINPTTGGGSHWINFTGAVYRGDETITGGIGSVVIIGGGSVGGGP